MRSNQILRRLNLKLIPIFCQIGWQKEVYTIAYLSFDGFFDKRIKRSLQLKVTNKSPHEKRGILAGSISNILFQQKHVM